MKLFVNRCSVRGRSSEAVAGQSDVRSHFRNNVAMCTKAPWTETCRIVLTEDDEAMAALLRYNIEAEGHTVEWINNGIPALVRLTSGSPDLVVLD